MTYYFNTQLGYYEGDRISPSDKEVPIRPDPSFNWDGSNWVTDSDSVLAKYKEDAKSLLEKTDMVAIRCFKAGVTFPDEWKQVTLTLRGIVSGTINLSYQLPALPTTYPENT